MVLVLLHYTAVCSCQRVVCMQRVPSYGQLCSYWFMFPLLADCSGAEYGQLHCRVHAALAAALAAALKRGGWAAD